MDPVARAGDVTASASQSTNYPTDTLPTATGKWSAGPVSETTVALAGSDGARVVRSASCTFTFTGTNSSSGAPVTVNSPVTLNPSPRVLTIAGHDPLVDGDEQGDTYGNTLKVASTSTWRTD